MKNISIINLMAMVLFTSPGIIAQNNNDFYDDAETNQLNGKTNIEISERVGNAVKIFYNR